MSRRFLTGGSLWFDNLNALCFLALQSDQQSAQTNLRSSCSLVAFLGLKIPTKIISYISTLDDLAFGIEFRGGLRA
ncbi:hypothetical protein [uncultured Ruegeria sp.]|uniref:hypothetical protein n=1 Tax=uncultured Ruegeria sp. TaxID=259304 RepID=UPI00261496C7|nr:hypothetical protein [uncultured Ruegeria sp.]